MTPESLRLLLCGAFRISQEEDTLLVHTPFALDFGDDLVLRIRPEGGGLRVDDNGDTLLALSMAGTAPDAERVQSLAPGIDFDEDDGSLIAISTNARGIANAVFSVASAALRVHGACLPRMRGVPSDFRERVLALLGDVAGETGAVLRLDQVVEETGSLIADAVMGEVNPLVVIVATSVERLMEAELLFLRRQIHKRPGFVCAVVPSAKLIGQKHFSRANYYTDKTLEFDDWIPAFREFATAHAGVASSLHH